MQAYHSETKLVKDGILTLENLPFHAGDTVEVIVLERKRSVDNLNPYPLRGTPSTYIRPMDPVAEEDWNPGL